MPIAAITGGSGFIGRELTRQLIAGGWRVRGLARSRSSAERLHALGAEVVVGGLDDERALAQLSDAVDALVHCAGVVRGARYRDFEAVNVTGSARLLDAVRGTTTPILALSSLAARKPMLSDYARSKRAMERLFEAEAEAEGGQRPWIALRPPAVYGPGDREMKALFTALGRGFAPLPASPEARVSLLYVTDLAAAVVAWLASADKVSGIYEIHDGREGGYSWEDVVAVAESLRNRRIRRLRLPGRALRLFARANARAAPRLRYAPMLTPGKLRELQYPDWVGDNAPLQRIVDWRPQVTLTEGLRRTCGWGVAAGDYGEDL